MRLLWERPIQLATELLQSLHCSSLGLCHTFLFLWGTWHNCVPSGGLLYFPLRHPHFCLPPAIYHFIWLPPVSSTLFGYFVYVFQTSQAFEKKHIYLRFSLRFSSSTRCCSFRTEPDSWLIFKHGFVQGAKMMYDVCIEHFVEYQWNAHSSNVEAFWIPLDKNISSKQRKKKNRLKCPGLRLLDFTLRFRFAQIKHWGPQQMIPRSFVSGNLLMFWWTNVVSFVWVWFMCWLIVFL